MDSVIEMKDLQEGASLDDDLDAEFGETTSTMHYSNGNGGRSSSYLPVTTSQHHHQDETNNGDVEGLAEPGVWLERRLWGGGTHRKNRCMVVVTVSLLLAAIVYVVGTVYMSGDDMDALVQPFERESGTVENGVENEKQQKTINGSNSHKPINGQQQHWGGNHNPFDSKANSAYFHSGQKGSQGESGDAESRGSHKNHVGKLGHNGHMDGSKRPSNFANRVKGNENVQQDVDDEPSDETAEGNGDASPQPDPTVVDEKDVYCEDLTQYQSWYDAAVTKSDGPRYNIVEQFEHDKKSFTQGLTYARGQLFESAGRYGQSTVRILDPDTGDVLKKVSMENKYFAEGMTYYKDTLVQITWKQQKGFIYNMTTLETIDEYSFTSTRNEGWGITWDRCKDELIVTDGSEFLHFWDPTTMAEKRKIPVTRQDGKEALEMNEIEFWRGRLLANVWYEDVLLVINPETGIVEKEYDFSSLWSMQDRSGQGADVFNGISVSQDPNILYVTGKNWNRMFKVELLPTL